MCAKCFETMITTYPAAHWQQAVFISVESLVSKRFTLYIPVFIDGTTQRRTNNMMEWFQFFQLFLKPNARNVSLCFSPEERYWYIFPLEILGILSDNVGVLSWFSTLQPASGGCGTGRGWISNPCFERHCHFWAKQPPSTSSRGKLCNFTLLILKKINPIFWNLHFKCLYVVTWWHLLI